MNKKNYMRISIVFIFSIVISIFSLHQVLFANDSKAEQLEMNEMKQDVSLVHDNTRLSFNYDKASIEFATGEKHIYKSVPDEEVSGLDRLTSLSMIAINVINSKGEIETYYSFSECVQKGTYQTYSDGQRLRIVYDFQDLGIKVPVEFVLNGSDSFKVTIPVSEVEDASQQLVDIALLPYMGAAHVSQQGYILVPDGSGAAIKFNNEKALYGHSMYTVYGTDAMDNKEYAEVNKNAVNLPMFAFMYEETEKNSLVAYITEGDALASLDISVSSASSPYNVAYFKFNYRPYTLATILDRTNKAMKLYIASQDIVECDTFEIAYTHFEKEEATLLSVAEYVAHNVFGDREKKSESIQKTFLDVYASVYKRVYTLGVPHQANVELTTLEDCQQIADDFENPVMLLRGLDKYGAISGTIDSKWKISRNVGDKQDYQKLKEKAELYSYSEFTLFDKNSVGAMKLFNSARSVTGKSLNSYYYNPATLLSEDHTYNLINPLKIEKRVEGYLKTVDVSVVQGLAPISLGNSPYTHNMKSDRQSTQEIFQQSLQKVNNSGLQLLLCNPDGFALQYAKTVMSLPTQSSKQSLIDYDIPFIQMVVRDYIDYSGEAVNISGNMNHAILNAARTGSNLCFAITNSNYKQIKDTELDFLYNADYGVSGKKFVEISERYNDHMSKTVTGRLIVYMDVSAGVYLTKFVNGTSVYVNYTDSEYELESGVLIHANDYYVISEEGNVQ